MNKRNDQLHLGAFIFYTGHHHSGWRHPDSGVEGMFDISFYQKVAQTAERGKFDMIFLADILFVSEVDHVASGMLEPLTVLSALSAVTKEIGLTATMSTTYSEPYNVARNFATLDFLSGGRAGWNIVTSQSDLEAQNYGKLTHPEHSLRYEMAEEFVDAVTSLWDSWQDDALVLNRESGMFADAAKVHAVDFKGKWYLTKGPLNVPRPPQGYPVLIQAGSSGPGQDLAARIGEVVFTAQPSLQGAKSFYTSTKAKMEAYGRKPDEMKIMPGLVFVIGSTEEEAKRKFDELQQLITPTAAMNFLSRYLNYDLSNYPIDQPLPDIPDPVLASNGMKSRVQLIMDMARRDNLTILELGRRILGTKGHLFFVGTPEQLADLTEEWFNAYGCDGFNVMPAVLPGGLEEFVEQVIPILQRRGLFRSDYTGTMLRDHLGLARPENQYVSRKLGESGSAER